MTDQPRGFLCLILHAHLPYVRHPGGEGCLEESWLFQAISESYLPLLEAMERLAERGVPYRLVLSVSPTLAAMLKDPFLMERYRGYLHRTIELADREVYRRRHCPPLQSLARYYKGLFSARLQAFEDRYRSDLLAPWRALADAGHLDLWTTAITHAYLPLLPEGAQKVQIELGIAAHRSWRGKAPDGFWLPECGFAPPAATALSAAGISCTAVEGHTVLHARPRPRWAVFAPVRCRDSGILLFGREADSARRVWSAKAGYPGHPLYREYYWDLGWDKTRGADGDTPPTPTGIKYYRVTGRPEKEPYEPKTARRQARIHARQYLAGRRRLLQQAARHMDRTPIIVAPFDAELFGHWWFEGPVFLEHLVQQAAAPDSGVRLVTPTDYEKARPRAQAVSPAPGSWGVGGYNAVWLDPANDWLQPPLHAAWIRLQQLVAAGTTAADAVPVLERRALQQAGRELLQAQCSDWPFMMRAGTTVEYGTRRAREHLERFDALWGQIRRGRIDAAALARWEWQTPFPSVVNPAAIINPAAFGPYRPPSSRQDPADEPAVAR